MKFQYDFFSDKALNILHSHHLIYEKKLEFQHKRLVAWILLSCSVVLLSEVKAINIANSNTERKITRLVR